jgi:hypothetical protein
MILRRVIVHVRKQEWLAIAIDFVIVVAGVFVGIQVSNWNAARIDRHQERDYLIRLYRDVEESLAGQVRDLNYLRQQLADQAVMLKSLDTCAVAPEDSLSFQRGLNTLGYVNPPRLYRRTIDEMAAAGRTDIIRNDAIKDRLASLVALVEWRANGYDSSARMLEHHRYIVEEQVRYDMASRIDDEFAGSINGVIFDIGELCADSATASAVSAVSYLTRERLDAYAPILEGYRAFLPLLADEIRLGWGVTIGAAAVP